MSGAANLYDNFRSRSIVERIIVLNILLFLLTYLFNTLTFLFNGQGNVLIEWLALKPSFETLLVRPWTILTYGFVHMGLLHILFNLLFLYYFGNLFLDFFSSRQFLVYYLLGIVAGGFIYMLSYNYLPALKTQETILIGASAGVTAIVIGIASHIPQYAMRFRFLGNIKLLYIAVAMVVLDVLQIPNGNAGGHLAHLGGALLGFLMTRYFAQGSALVDWTEQLFRPKRKGPLKTVYKSSRPGTPAGRPDETEQEKIDSILDKISKSGYDALTKEEKDFLFKAGKK